MATHGLLLGGLAGIWLFSRIEQRSFLSVTDMLVIPAAVIMGLGRIGNFIDGQIVGCVTTVPWAVKFPDADGFRHPVVLYDGLKNLLIVPVLIYLGRRQPPRGVQTGVFLFLYAFLRIFVDLVREYPTTLLGLATGQVLNILMALAGLGLIFVPLWKTSVPVAARLIDDRKPGAHRPPEWRPWLFTAILLFSMTLPSDWTQDIPLRYGHRHAGVHHSILYPHIPTAEISN